MIGLVEKAAYLSVGKAKIMEVWQELEMRTNDIALVSSVNRDSKDKGAIEVTAKNFSEAYAILEYLDVIEELPKNIVESIIKKIKSLFSKR